MVMAMGLLPNASAEHWRAGWPRLNYDAAVTRADVKGNCQSGEAEGDASCHQATAVRWDTFLTKFQCMARFHHLCASLEGAVGQVLGDIGPRATTADIIHLLQTRFGT